ncbi:ATP-grasp domain-containing protein [Bradyrhizobium sp. S69]|uniref:ATP-grasp domain-containing protein n=1 Tax=Bradyrhizobium sp. S69 TaxID=1641856 RepID=UPI00131C9D72|nr:ATP-grasp domain-containing protein [Bradyrhizobium sp. S69]
MAVAARVPKSLRVLVSEGNSTSAREAITILGLSGHRVEVCDPSRVCLARFSRFLSRFHRCPGLRQDPAGFLGFVERLLAAQHFDVLLPVHEQGFLFARVGQRLSGRTGIALPAFESYRVAHNKAGFSRLLDQLRLPQPPTQIVKSEAELRVAMRFPSVVKTSVGTASRGIWFVRNADDLEAVMRDLRAQGLSGQDLSVQGLGVQGFGANRTFADEVLVQDFVNGITGKAQAVFCRGQLLGFHGYRQIAAGAGGGEAIKQSESRADVRAHVAAIGEHLGWHGALSVDYVLADAATPLLIDCNPRLVEPMSAYLAGVDLVGLLLAISQGEIPQASQHSRDGVRTHLAMQALLGCASRGGDRKHIARTCWQLAARRGAYADSTEELTPARLDWVSLVPLAMVALALLVQPRWGATLANKGWGAHLLDLDSIAIIARQDFPG